MKRDYTISSSLLARIRFAAHNGDPIAVWIHERLKNPHRSEVFVSDVADHFRGKITRNNNGGIREFQVRYCTLSTRNPFGLKELKANPDAPYFSSRTSDASLSKFCDMFIGFPVELRTDAAKEAFREAIILGTPIDITISDKLEDFQYAYDGANYAPKTGQDTDTLNNSCMRYDNLWERVAAFYKFVGHCKIMLVQNTYKQVLGRAIIWQSASFFVRDTDNTPRYKDCSFISRMYYNSPAIRDMMIRKAGDAKIPFRMARQALECKHDFIVLNDEVPDATKGAKMYFERVEVPLFPSRQYQSGVPYVDVFEDVILRDGNLYLKNGSCRQGAVSLACCQHTSGYISSRYRLCPICGEKFEGYNENVFFCPTCMTKSKSGIQLPGFVCKKTVDVLGYGKVPSVCTHRGHLTHTAEVAALLNKMKSN